MKRKLHFLLFAVILTALSVSASSTTCAQTEKGWTRLLDNATYDVSVNPLNPDMMIVGGVGRVWWRTYDGGKTWQKNILIFEAGSTQFNNVLIHPRDTNVYIIGGLNFKDFKRTTDGGKTWETVLHTNEGISLNGKAMEYRADAPDTIYIGDFKSANIYRSIDRGATWDSIGTVRKKFTIKDTVNNTEKDTLISIEIASLGIRNDSSNVLLVGSTWGELYISNDGGYNWNLAQVFQKPYWDYRDCEITRITFSDRDPRTGYAVITYLFGGNLPNGGLFKTTDGGYSWDLIAFADTSMWTVACRGFNNSDEVFIGGYTEDYYVDPSIRVPGVGIVRRSQDGGLTWTSQDETMDWYAPPFEVMRDFNSVYFLNIDTGFVAANDGVILRTDERANKPWTYFMKSNTTEDLNFITFPTNMTGFSAGDNGTILRSTDQGYNWVNLASGTTNDLYSIDFVSPSEGYISGEDGLILKTTSTGNSWNTLQTNITEDLYSVFFVNNQKGFAAGDNGTILRTTDEGSNWSTLNTGTAEDLKSIFFVNENKGYAVGTKGILLTTENAGDSWTITPLERSVTLNTVFFYDPTYGWAAGDSGVIFITRDGGQNWNISQATQTQTSLKRGINQIFMIDSMYGYAAVDNGAWYRTLNGFDYIYSPLLAYGPLANMWSQRYFGPKGDEKLYMATEAGFFYYDQTVSVEEYFSNSNDKRLSAYIKGEQLLNIKYTRQSTDKPLSFRLVNLLGEAVYSIDLVDSYSSSFTEEFIIPKLPKGAYACQMFEGSNVTTCMIMAE